MRPHIDECIKVKFLEYSLIHFIYKLGNYYGDDKIDHLHTKIAGLIQK